MARTSRRSIPAFVGSLNRDQKYVRRVLSDYDLMFCVGSDVLKMSVLSEVEPLPETTKVAMVGLRDWEMGKNFPAEIALRADVKETLKALVPLLKKLGGATLAERAKASLAEIAAAQLDRAARRPQGQARHAADGKAAAGRMADDAAVGKTAQGRHHRRRGPHQRRQPDDLLPVPRPQQLLRQCRAAASAGASPPRSACRSPSPHAASWR